MKNEKIALIIIGNNNIEKCIENIRKQSYINDIEIIVLYNENNEEQIENIRPKYEKIQFLSYKQNMFKAIKQNENLIKGKYVSILNSEDDITIDFYRTMAFKAVKNNADMVISNAILKYKDGGKAYLNLSEASLKELNGKENLKEYLNLSTVSFLWNIFGNKIFTKELFIYTVDSVCEKEENVQNFYFFTVMLYYSKKVNIVKNEVLFYSFEEKNFESARSILSNKEIKEENLYENTKKNFEYIDEFFKNNNIDSKIENLKEIYLKKDTNLKKDILLKNKTAWNDNLEKLKKEIISDNTQIVSFDIFDTLILRPFWNPIDLFSFIDEYFKDITKMKTGMDFSKLRVEAEKVARKRYCTKKEIQDITLDEIYEELRNETKLDEKIIELLKIKEQELEIKYCTKRNVAMEIYELAKYLNKEVICTSDMYLPIETIRKIIEKNGYIIEKIYLSSQIKLTKFTGDLYKYVLKDLNVQPEKIVHVGDNYYSDYEQAKKQEINAMFLPKTIDVFCNENITNALSQLYRKNMSVWESNSNGLNFMGIRSMLAMVANKYFDNPYRTFNNETDFNCDPNLIGYYALGMHLYGITDWLIKDSIKENYDRIVFMARDGYWVMKAYEIIKNSYPKAPEEFYLYISRRATIPITLNNRLDFFKLSELIDIYKYTPITILKYIKNILHNTEKINEECEKIGLNVNQKFESKSEFNNYMNLIIEKFYDENKHKTIVENLKKYFLNAFDKKSCAFDIGYSAKPELYLSEICGKPIDTYFINISNEEALKNAKIGKFRLKTYFDYRPTITGVVRESLMSTADASCIGYDFDSSGNVIPIFDEKEENYQKRFIFDAMQKKAMEFIEDITKTFKDDIEKMYYQKYYISLAHEMYINSAKKIDQDVFYGIDFEDAVGLGENITAINEWNSELEKNNQKRTTELFDTDCAKNIKERYLKLEKKNIELENQNAIFKEEQEKMTKEKVQCQNEINMQKQQIRDYEEKYEAKNNELEKVYNSKRWQLMEKIDNILKRKK